MLGRICTLEKARSFSLKAASNSALMKSFRFDRKATVSLARVPLGGPVRSFSTPPPGGGFNIFGNQNDPSGAKQQQPGQYLEQYGLDLTQRALDGKLDPVIGRHDEIRRTLEILARRTKNNPILIGEPGTGKTALAEGLAQRIASRQVPDSIQDKRVIALDVASLVSGAMFRGQFEERIRGIIRDVEAAKGDVVLFIDEVHTILSGGGKSSDGMDMANMLKPALARGDLQLVGATTLKEFRLVEKDAALARRFQPVYIQEPNVQDTISILRGLKASYELHHGGIRIQDDALVAAATLSNRYIADRFQPDKSIDLIDEASSALRLEQESKPEPIWKVERDLLTKQIELSALEQEIKANDNVGSSSKIQARKEEVEAEVKELTQKLKVLNDAWQDEKDELERGKRIQEDLENARRELDLAKQRGDFNKAGELQHATIPRLTQGVHELQQQQQQEDGGNVDGQQNKMLQDAVTPQAIAAVVSRHTGIPVSRIASGAAESRRLLQMEDELRHRVVGQDHALEAVANCVRLARTRLQATDRTLGNFLFVGPTGVGKTELCKALASFLFDNDDAMTRIDMSEYGEKHSISRLIGPPPGYVGFEDAPGVLTERVRRRPYQVILLDEFEKAHSDVWNLLLQLFDEGHLTDSHGRRVDFRNVIVVMTSNMGANIFRDAPSHMTGKEQQVQEGIMEVVRHTLSPELLNRIDDVIIFQRLQRDHMDEITQIGINEIAKRLEESQNMTLDVSQFALECLSEKGYDVRYGARPLNRILSRDLLNPLSRMVLEGGVKDGDVVRVRTLAEANKLAETMGQYGFLAGKEFSDNKNDVVILRNHAQEKEEEEEEEDQQQHRLLGTGGDTP